MTTVIEYEDGFLFEVDGPLEATEYRAARAPNVPHRVIKTFQEALDKQVKPAAEMIVSALKNAGPDEIALEIGMKMKGEIGAVFSRGSADAHIVIKMTWKPKNAK